MNWLQDREVCLFTKIWEGDKNSTGLLQLYSIHKWKGEDVIDTACGKMPTLMAISI